MSERCSRNGVMQSWVVKCGHFCDHSAASEYCCYCTSGMRLGGWVVCIVCERKTILEKQRKVRAAGAKRLSR